jgi:hypothetical protein
MTIESHSLRRIAALLDELEKRHPLADLDRFYSRAQTESIISAALWGHCIRSDSTAGAYVGDRMFKALELKFWTFDEREAAELRKMIGPMLRTPRLTRILARMRALLLGKQAD